MFRLHFLTIVAIIRGALFFLFSRIWVRKVHFSGCPRCYSWPYLQVANGTLIVGKNVRIGKVKIILANEGILNIGDGAGINDGTVIGVMSNVTIGKNSAIAENVMIRDHDHDYSDARIGEAPKGYRIAPILIEDGCWIGYGAAITKGVVIRAGAIVGANSVVTKSCTPGDVLGGVPARVLRNRSEVV